MIITNTRCLRHRTTGVQRYLQNILNCFPKDIKQISPEGFIEKKINGHLWEQFILPQKISKKDLLWSPANSCPIIGGFKKVLSVHDLAPIEYPQFMTAIFRTWYQFMIPKIIANADVIITPSLFIKERILAVYKNTPEQKIKVVYPGVTEFVSNEKKKQAPSFLPTNKFILSVCSADPRKNIKNLILAWNNVYEKLDPEIFLILVGGKNKNIFKDLALNALPPRVIFTNYINENDLQYLYNNALFFVYLSLYEGFGSPPIEAMRAGLPCLVSDIPVFNEVHKDASYKVNPNSVSEICFALLELINNRALRTHLKDKGLALSLHYDYKKTANEVLEILKSV